MSDKIDMIYDLLKEDRKENTEFRKEVRESHKETADKLSKLEAQSEVQNTQLADHMRRTALLEELHGINADRIDEHDVKIAELEKPRIVLSTLKKWLLCLGALAGAGAAIAKFIGLF